jgi:hypothetical protein
MFKPQENVTATENFPHQLKLIWLAATKIYIENGSSPLPFCLPSD